MAPATRPASASALQARLHALSPREKKLLAVAAILLAVTLLFLLIGRGEEEGGGGVELAQAPPPPPSAPAHPLPAPPAPPMPGPAADTGTISGLVLKGVLGGGASGGAAIFGAGDGSQRLVRVGRPVLPGVMLKEVGIGHALLSTPSGDMRLEFNKAAEFQAAPALAAAAANAPPPGGESRERDTLQYRIGLEPRRQDGRISGFTVKPGAELPVLTRAGLRPGDVLVAVNGQPFESEEKVLELSSEIAGSYEAEFTFERAGQRLTAKAKVNERPAQ